MRWLRTLLRRNMAPIPKDTAMKWKSRLSALYFFSAWNAFILIVIFAVKQQNPRTEEDDKYPSRWYAKIIGTDDARVIKYSGLTKVGEYEITGMKRAPRGRTRAEREADGLDDGEFYTTPAIKEIEMKNREDLNLLVEETSSL